MIDIYYHLAQRQALHYDPYTGTTAAGYLILVTERSSFRLSAARNGGDSSDLAVISCGFAVYRFNGAPSISSAPACQCRAARLSSAGSRAMGPYLWCGVPANKRPEGQSLSSLIILGERTPGKNQSTYLAIACQVPIVLIKSNVQ